MSSAGSFTVVHCGLCLAMLVLSAGTNGRASLLAVHYFLLSYGPVAVTTLGVVSTADPIASIAIVPIVAINDSVVDQGSVLILTELTDQLRFKS